MIKVYLFDVDGVVIKEGEYFSKRFSNKYRVPWSEKVLPFFTKEFQLCLVGKAELKEEIVKYLGDWGYKGSIDDLLKFWFEGESEINDNVVKIIDKLRKNSVKVFLATNNERYRVNYLLDNLGLRDRFDGVFASCNLGALKSKQEFWEKIYLELGDVEKNEIMFWDNEIENIESAREFGLRAELFTDFESLERKLAELD